MRLIVKTKILIGIRIRKGLNQTELAARAGITGGFMSQIERGIYRPSPRTAYRIAEALEVGFDEIFSLADPQNNKDSR
ncbi:MAG: helix-turn-helix transcriptional regulator [Actinobacteria bacterium]|nr:helix-turn-helix transcriptional regulator [Actinomycetota bacterium]